MTTTEPESDTTETDPPTPQAVFEDIQMHTTDEVAALFKVRVETVSRWIREGRLEAIRIGERGHYRVSTVELRRFAKANHGPMP